MLSSLSSKQLFSKLFYRQRHLGTITRHKQLTAAKKISTELVLRREWLFFDDKF